jgi:hypothetical protein
LRKAIELQGFEENRHARLLAALTARYRIPIQAPPPARPISVEDDFLLAGFGECFDSFFAFGLIDIAGKSGYFTLSPHKDLGSDLTLHALLGRCLAENERRMAPYDARLLRPRLVPTIARLLYRLLPASI